MRTSRRYSNTTFTRRVDHEAGRHRPPRRPPGVRACTRCGAVYARSRWVGAGTPQAEALKALGEAAPTVCPACAMVADGRFAGEVRLGGTFLALHHDEIKSLLQREAERAGEDNPLARILEVSVEAPDHLVVRTSTEHLAQRLGEAVAAAYGGTVHYEFGHENKVALVTWMRGA